MTTTLSRPETTTAEVRSDPGATRPGLGRLTAVELRKATDTRAGRWLLLVTVALAGAGLAYRLYVAQAGPVSYEYWFATALQPVQMLLPVLGVLAMTSEWTQRTVLTTFTLVPRRGRVMTAKLVVAVLLALATVTVAAVLSAVAVSLGGALTGEPVVWGDLARVVGGASTAAGLGVLMGAAFGALLQQTAAALVAYFVVPTLWVAVATPLLGDGADWLNIYAAFSAIAGFAVGGSLATTLTAVGAWVALPTVLGAWRWLRREAA